jgi:hypothetical protein
MSSTDNCSAQNRSRELKLVSLEPPGNEDSEYVLKIFYHVCERNSNAKHLAKPFSTFEGGGVLWNKSAQRGSGNFNTL